MSDTLGARHLEVSAATWAILGRAAQWRENRYFLDRTMTRGEQVVLSHPPRVAKPGSAYDRELRYPRSRGVTIIGDQHIHVLPRRRGN